MPPPLARRPRRARSTVGGPFHDALVFVGLLPEDSENHLIKRVIGLPGDHVQADGDTGKLKVNGVEITEPYVKPGDYPSEGKKFDITVPAGASGSWATTAATPPTAAGTTTAPGPRAPCRWTRSSAAPSSSSGRSTT